MPKIPQPRDPVLAQLVARYDAFRRGQPLAIGIHKALMALHPEIDAGALRKTMKWHTASTQYLKAVAAGGARFGLDGLPAGEITAVQQQQARQIVGDRFSKQAEQRRERLNAQARQAKLRELVDKFKPS